MLRGDGGPRLMTIHIDMVETLIPAPRVGAGTPVIGKTKTGTTKKTAF